MHNVGGLLKQAVHDAGGGRKPCGAVRDTTMGHWQRGARATLPNNAWHDYVVRVASSPTLSIGGRRHRAAAHRRALRGAWPPSDRSPQGPGVPSDWVPGGSGLLVRAVPRRCRRQEHVAPQIDLAGCRPPATCSGSACQAASLLVAGALPRPRPPTSFPRAEHTGPARLVFRVSSPRTPWCPQVNPPTTQSKRLPNGRFRPPPPCTGHRGDNANHPRL